LNWGEGHEDPHWPLVRVHIGLSVLILGSARQSEAQGPTFNPLDGSESAWSAGNDDLAKVARGFSESALYKFCSVSQCADGYNPLGGLVQDGASNLSGTTFAGGSSFGTYDNGGGTVFKVDSSGHETVLYNFCSMTNCADGQLSYAGLILDVAGNLYGTTSQGGANNGGTAFKVTQNGQETVLYSFCSAPNCADGQLPYAGLIRDAAGNLYGTTTYGGANNGGTVFKLDKNGYETVLYSFCSVPNCIDGQQFKLSADGDSTATVAFTSSPNPSYVNESVTISVAVSGGGATPTGSVIFREGTNVLRSLTLTNGTASFAMAFAKAGNDALLVASYSGDPTYKPANSNVLKQVVRRYTTTTVLGSSLNPSTYGQSVTLTATVSSSGPTPTGNVTFKSRNSWLGSAPLNGGVATTTVSNLSAGSSTITASYGGDTASAKARRPLSRRLWKRPLRRRPSFLQGTRRWGNDRQVHSDGNVTDAGIAYVEFSSSS
jgi:uncharacterized repeat protein (TIGR03803 family)